MGKFEQPELIKEFRGKQLDEFQARAIAAIARRDSVIVAAPTGAGKTLIAEFALDQALREGKRVIYTAPIKALSNQKFRDFSALFPGEVGITTGDVSIRPDAAVVIMTTEIFRNTIFESPERLSEVEYVIYDEIHFMDDPDRGTVWEESIIFAPEQIRIVALSATVSNLRELTQWIESVRPGHLEVVVEKKRPVPLKYFISDVEEGIRPYSPGNFETMKAKTRAAKRRKIRSIPDRFRRSHRQLVKSIHGMKQLPCLFFLFSRSACERLAEECAYLDFYEEDDERYEALDAFDRLLEMYQVDARGETVINLRRLLAHGITYHHAGLLPVLKEIIEQMFAAGHIRMVFATETFAIGVNMPARSVAFDSLRKFNGRGRVPLKTREFLQMAGRAGRRGLDTEGVVYATYDPVLDEPALAREVMSGGIEPVLSQFNLSYATLLNLYRHLGPRIYEACEQSFANFLSKKHGSLKKHKKGKKHKQNRRKVKNRSKKQSFNQQQGEQSPGLQSLNQQVENKLKLLHELGYVNLDAPTIRQRLTQKGRFAATVYGRELTATELLFEGLLDHVSAEKLVVVLTALVFESRTDTIPSPIDPAKLLGKTYNKINSIVERITVAEKENSIRDRTGKIDWKLTAAVLHWATGDDFDMVKRYTNVSDGDIVRTLRQTLQLIRMVAFPLKKATDFNRPMFFKIAQRLETASELIKRDLVDAEWQLKVREEQELARAEEEERDKAGRGHSDENSDEDWDDYDDEEGVDDGDEAHHELDQQSRDEPSRKKRQFPRQDSGLSSLAQAGQFLDNLN